MSKNHVEKPCLKLYLTFFEQVPKSVSIHAQNTSTSNRDCDANILKKEASEYSEDETLQHCTVSFLRRVDTKHSPGPGPRSRLQVRLHILVVGDVSVTTVWIWEHKKVKEG